MEIGVEERSNAAAVNGVGSRLRSIVDENDILISSVVDITANNKPL